ncbi:hypothetical protein Pelo_9279 [Pelomyxa schiedti]|nr:hypothetical protein Pelo_9279 [Pelomyxa schiedti]
MVDFEAFVNKPTGRGRALGTILSFLSLRDIKHLSICCHATHRAILVAPPEKTTPSGPSHNRTSPTPSPQQQTAEDRHCALVYGLLPTAKALTMALEAVHNGDLGRAILSLKSRSHGACAALCAFVHISRLCLAGSGPKPKSPESEPAAAADVDRGLKTAAMECAWFLHRKKRDSCLLAVKYAARQMASLPRGSRASVCCVAAWKQIGALLQDMPMLPVYANLRECGRAIIICTRAFSSPFKISHGAILVRMEACSLSSDSLLGASLQSVVLLCSRPKRAQRKSPHLAQSLLQASGYDTPQEPPSTAATPSANFTFDGGEIILEHIPVSWSDRRVVSFVSCVGGLCRSCCGENLTVSSLLTSVVATYAPRPGAEYGLRLPLVDFCVLQSCVHACSKSIGPHASGSTETVTGEETNTQGGCTLSDLRRWCKPDSLLIPSIHRLLNASLLYGMDCNHETALYLNTQFSIRSEPPVMNIHTMCSIPPSPARVHDRSQAPGSPSDCPFLGLQSFDIVAEYNTQPELCAICYNTMLQSCIVCSGDEEQEQGGRLLQEQSDHSNGEAAQCGIAAGVCGHVFHAHCISRWMRITQACPVCTAPWPLSSL